MGNTLNKKDSKEHAVATLRELVFQLNISVRPATVENFRHYSSNPSLATFAEILDEWNVDNVCVRLDLEQLREIPYPAIAHLKRNNGRFVLLVRYEDDILEYIDPEAGTMRESLLEFARKWTGIALLVNKTERSGEEDYEKKRRADAHLGIANKVAWGMLIALCLLPMLFFSMSTALGYLIKILGLSLCSLAMYKQFGNTTLIVDAICGMGKKGDCGEVIYSAKSKIFGFFYFSEVGALYFAGVVFTTILGALAMQHLSTPLTALSILAVAVTVRALYLQGLVIKKWCPLCITIIAVVWADCAVSMLSHEGYLTATVMPIAFVGFGVPVLFWISIRRRFMDSLRVRQLEMRLNRFLRNENVFQGLLEQQRPIGDVPLGTEICAGPQEAALTLTVVSNPDCIACAHTHAIIEDLLYRFDGAIRITFRFALGPERKAGIGREVLAHLIQLHMSGAEGTVLRALSTWYLNYEKGTISDWKNAFPHFVETPDDWVNAAIAEHSEWCRRTGISATPTILIEGKRLPDEYQITDLKYHVKRLLDARELNVNAKPC